MSEAQPSVLQHHFASLSQQKETSTLGMWAFLVQEVLFFGGLLTVYTVYRNQYYSVFEACSHHLDWKLGAANTAVLRRNSKFLMLPDFRVRLRDYLLEISRALTQELGSRISSWGAFYISPLKCLPVKAV